MKKIISVILVLLFVFGFCACEEKVNNEYTSDEASIGIKALEIADEYLNGNISGSIASGRLETLMDRLNTENTRSLLLHTEIMLLSMDIKHYDSEYYVVTKQDIQEKRDSLYDLLYK